MHKLFSFTCSYFIVLLFASNPKASSAANPSDEEENNGAVVRRLPFIWPWLPEEKGSSDLDHLFGKDKTSSLDGLAVAIKNQSFFSKRAAQWFDCSRASITLQGKGASTKAVINLVMSIKTSKIPECDDGALVIRAQVLQTEGVQDYLNPDVERTINETENDDLTKGVTKDLTKGILDEEPYNNARAPLEQQDPVASKILAKHEGIEENWHHVENTSEES